MNVVPAGPPQTNMSESWSPTRSVTSIAREPAWSTYRGGMQRLHWKIFWRLGCLLKWTHGIKKRKNGKRQLTHVVENILYNFISFLCFPNRSTCEIIPGTLPTCISVLLILDLEGRSPKNSGKMGHTQGFEHCINLDLWAMHSPISGFESFGCDLIRPLAWINPIVAQRRGSGGPYTVKQSSVYIIVLWKSWRGDNLYGRVGMVFWYYFNDLYRGDLEPYYHWMLPHKPINCKVYIRGCIEEEMGMYKTTYESK